jgi:hypothetical protein
MRKAIEGSLQAVCALMLVLPLWLAAPAVQAADSDSKVSADAEEAKDSPEPMSNKIERLGNIRRFKVIDLRARQQNGLLQVQATLHNGRKSQDIVYRARWFDKDGFSVWEDEAWKPLSLYDHQKTSLLFVAPTPKATDFRLQFQSEQGHEKARDKATRH